MFYEEIAQLTAEHLRTHIKAYLDAVNAAFSGSDKTTLIVPKDISAASVVGGIISELPETLPQYGVDCFGKILSTSGDNLWTYEYDGQINGMVSGGSRNGVDILVKRHASAVENFIKNHQFFHQENNPKFSIIEFAYVGSDFSGATPLEEVQDRELWLAAFSLDVSWLVSENGPAQHG